MKTTKLSAIADVQCGLVLNRKEARTAETANRHYRRLNLRSLQKDGRLNTNELGNLDSVECLDEQFLTRSGDIIIRFFAPLSPVFIQDSEVGLVIPSQLAVMRIEDDVPVLTEYLRWYLSSTAVSNTLLLTESSHVQRSIKIRALSALSVPMLPLEKQELIIRIYETGLRRDMVLSHLREVSRLSTSSKFFCRAFSIFSRYSLYLSCSISICTYSSSV
jgi:hypothetical protein